VEVVQVVHGAVAVVAVVALEPVLAPVAEAVLLNQH